MGPHNQNPDGTFDKCKARWVRRGLLDRQKEELQTDSPTARRPGFRLTCQLAANKGWDVSHIDLKTAFLQGESYDELRNVVCQLPPEAGLLKSIFPGEPRTCVSCFMFALPIPRLYACYHI